jgi:glycosyltransferase involved in cell wall biosynthesis
VNSSADSDFSAEVQLSVVIPMYNTGSCLAALHERLTATLSQLVPSYEIILVEDHGPDDSWERMVALAQTDAHVRIFRMSRNFGQHPAITAGLAQARGKWAVVMDGDLQDPPETIPELYAMATQGKDIVFAVRKKRKHHLLKRLTANLYARFISIIFGVSIDSGLGSFSLISRQVIDAFLTVQDRDRHYLYILMWLGFEAGHCEYEHQERHSGSTSYTFRRLIEHAINGIFFQTATILRWIVMIGFAVSAMGLALGTYYTSLYFMRDVAVEGWTTLVVLILVLCGFIILSCGITGLYVGQIFHQVKGRPLYVLRTQNPTPSGANNKEPRA